MSNLSDVRSQSYFLLSFLLIFLLTNKLPGQNTVSINELMASNHSIIADEDGEYADWIELYNYGENPVRLKGWGLSDNHEKPFKWVFPDVTIQPGMYLLVWASGKDRSTQSLHTNFSISSDGEPVILTNENGILSDHVPETRLPGNVSYGRYPDATGAFHYFYQPTPNAANTTIGLTELLTQPDFSHEAGFFSGPFNLTISHANPELTIIYTIDGSEPKADNIGGKTYQYMNSYPNGGLLTNSIQTYIYDQFITIQDRTFEPNKVSAISSTSNANPKYLPNIPIKKATVVKARVLQNGVEGPMRASTFFISSSAAFHFNNLPIISLSFNENDFFEYNNGIYVAGKDFVTSSGGRICGYGNYNRRGPENEKGSYFEFFQNNTRVFNQGAGIRITGNCSRNFVFKSTRIIARSEYDKKNLLNYGFFKNSPAVMADPQFKRLIMRNPNSFDYAFSELFHGIFEGVLGRIQPAIQFMNGELWGLTLLRERFDADHLFHNHGLNPDNVAIIKIGYGWDVGQPGQEHLNRVWYISEGKQEDLDDFFSMKDFIAKNNMASSGLYQMAKQRLDMESYVNHMILKTFAGDNHYAPEIVFWKTRVAENSNLGDGRWRVFVKDFDAATSISENIIQMFAEKKYPRDFGAEIFTSLLKNEEFKTIFINRFADLLNSFLTRERFDKIINDIFDDIIPVWEEVSTERWGDFNLSNPPRGFDNTDKVSLLEWSNIHPARQRTHIRNFFKIPGNVNFTLNISDVGQGHLKINTIDILGDTPGIADNPYPWTGIYFQGIPVKLEAVPAPGYVFSHWEGIENANTPIIYRTFTQSSVSVKAHFKKGQILYSWNFNHLPQGVISDIPSDFAGGNQGLITYQGNGAGYMDRVNDGTLLNAMEGELTGYGLRVRNPSAERELVIEAPTTGFRNIVFSYATKRTTYGAEIQKVQYRTSLDGVWRDLGDNVRVEEQWKLQRFILPANADNNPDFALKILFGGEQTTGESGNNRFDNVRLEGLGFTVSVNNDVSEIDTGIDGNKMKLWYNNEILYLDNPYQGNKEITIYSMNGIVAAKYKINGSGHHKLSFSGQNGLYIARITGSEWSSNMRFIVMNP
jgi:hypothetical protein